MGTSETKGALRRLPAVDELVREAELRGLGPRWALVRAVREVVAELRKRVLDGEVDTPDAIDLGALDERVSRIAAPSLQKVINATGVVLHTNLGRAPLAPCALEQLQRVAGCYSNLEYDLEAGRRGSRHLHLAEIVREVCGAEDAVVVNNNAAAVLLCLAAHAAGREVVVSRGELIEIGGSFRIPEIMAASGARLREVGTTNRTHLEDYRAAIADQTALLLKVHHSNYAIVGFTAEVSGHDIVNLGRDRGVVTMFDLGSGTLVDLRRYGLPAEPTVPQVVRAGFDLVTFSGDKLLGGPQAGVVCGRREAVAAVRSHPLMRAVRPDKMTIAALQATLRVYRDGAAEGALPALSMLAVDDRTLRQRADRLLSEAGPQLNAAAAAEIVQVTSRVGGGAAPTGALPSWAVMIEHRDISAGRIEELLRRQQPPVIARIEDGRLLLDVRTVLDEQVSTLARLVVAATT